MYFFIVYVAFNLITCNITQIIPLVVEYTAKCMYLRIYVCWSQKVVYVQCLIFKYFKSSLTQTILPEFKRNQMFKAIYIYRHRFVCIVQMHASDIVYISTNIISHLHNSFVFQFESPEQTVY